MARLASTSLKKVTKPYDLDLLESGIILTSRIFPKRQNNRPRSLSTKLGGMLPTKTRLGIKRPSHLPDLLFVRFDKVAAEFVEAVLVPELCR